MDIQNVVQNDIWDVQNDVLDVQNNILDVQNDILDVHNDILDVQNACLDDNGNLNIQKYIHVCLVQPEGIHMLSICRTVLKTSTLQDGYERM